MESSLFDFFREVMMPRDVESGPLPNDRRGGYPPLSQEDARERLRFAMKLQQYTGPVQAKGLEDTAFYSHNVLLTINDVGGDPGRFGRSVAEFHEASAERLRNWPLEMLATSTHDTKLGEDVRARINAIPELATEWAREAGRWMRLNNPCRTPIEGEPAPDRNDEYRFYQALIGCWPLDDAPLLQPAADLAARMQEYMLKAVREAKVHTSWLTPNQLYEDALKTFVERVLDASPGNKFLPALAPFLRKAAAIGMVSSLSQVVVKLGSPGVPDFYQGTELWDLNLVDPDNRRPVDFDRRRTLLDEVDRVLALGADQRPARLADMLERWTDGRIKLLITAAGLRLRRQDPELFLSGGYVPLATELTIDGNAIAFARIHEDRAMLFVGPRLCARLFGPDLKPPIGEAWKTSRVLLSHELTGRTFRHELTGVEIRPTSTGDQTWIFLGQIFEHVPVGILRAI
jgi:(1->4)-alpha-D-glucan 1-alpha-D-glucosylmutase